MSSQFTTAGASLPGQSAQLHLLDIKTGTSLLHFASSDRLFESPNWHPDGQWIVVNADGFLYRINVQSPWARADTVHRSSGVNNDHLVSPDGRWHYVSANDWHLYRLPREGGHAERLTRDKGSARYSGIFFTACRRTAGHLPTLALRCSTAMTGVSVPFGFSILRRAPSGY